MPSLATNSDQWPPVATPANRSRSARALVAPLITPDCQPSVAGEEHRLERGGWSRRCGVTGAEGSPPRTRTGSVALVSLAEARANQDGPRPMRRNKPAGGDARRRRDGGGLLRLP